jgi:hypothetical protein
MTKLRPATNAAPRPVTASMIRRPPAQHSHSSGSPRPTGITDTLPEGSASIAPWATNHRSVPTRAACGHPTLTRAADIQATIEGTTRNSNPATAHCRAVSSPMSTGDRSATRCGAVSGGRVSRLITGHHPRPTPPVGASHAAAAEIGSS